MKFMHMMKGARNEAIFQCLKLFHIVHHEWQYESKHSLMLGNILDFLNNLLQEIFCPCHCYDDFLLNTKYILLSVEFPQKIILYAE
jgi:hypothetical protein